MATVTITKALGSSNSLRYLLTADGAAAGNLDRATLISDCALKAGTPLYDLLNTAVGSQAAARTLAFDRTDLKISLLQRDADAAWIIDANTSGGYLRLTLTCAAADTSTGSILSIDFVHTKQQ